MIYSLKPDATVFQSEDGYQVVIGSGFLGAEEGIFVSDGERVFSRFYFKVWSGLSRKSIPPVAIREKSAYLYHVLVLADLPLKERMSGGKWKNVYEIVRSGDTLKLRGGISSSLDLSTASVVESSATDEKGEWREYIKLSDPPRSIEVTDVPMAAPSTAGVPAEMESPANLST